MFGGVFAISVKSNSHKSSLPQLLPKLHLIHQIWLQTIDNMVAGSKPNSMLESVGGRYTFFSTGYG